MSMPVIMTIMTVNVVVSSKDGHLDDIKDEAGNSGHKHNVFLDLRRSKQSVIGSEKQPNGDTPEESKRKDGTDNLSAVVTERHRVVSCSLG